MIPKKELLKPNESREPAGTEDQPHPEACPKSHTSSHYCRPGPPYPAPGSSLPRFARVASCIAFVFLSAILATRAELVTPLPIEELTRQAQLIVRGTVVSTNCQKDLEGRIFTRIELNIADVWKGTPAANPLIVVHGGGVLGKERVAVTDQVEYAIGEEVVGFFVINQRGEAVTLGLSQGKFHVDRSPSGEPEVHNPFHGTPRLSGHAHGSGRTSLTLTTLHERIKNVK